MGYAAKDSGHLADVMAAASSNANTNVGMMGETFKYAAAVAGAMGYSMEDVTLATGLMADAGIKATQAGTSLRSIISRMAAPTGAVQKTMDQLGVSMTDSNGKARPFRDVLVDLRKAMSGMSETEKTAAASTLAGKNAMSGYPIRDSISSICLLKSSSRIVFVCLPSFTSISFSPLSLTIRSMMRGLILRLLRLSLISNLSIYPSIAKTVNSSGPYNGLSVPSPSYRFVCASNSPAPFCRSFPLGLQCSG